MVTVSACPNTASAERSQKSAPRQEILDRTNQLRTKSNHRKGATPSAESISPNPNQQLQPGLPRSLQAALPAALNFRLGFWTALPFAAILFATPARMLASPCALIFLLGAGVVNCSVPLIFAHLAIWAARILALPAALTFRLFLGASIAWAGVGTSPPRISVSSFCRASILSLMSAAFRSCVGVALNIVRAIGTSGGIMSSRRSFDDLDLQRNG